MNCTVQLGRVLNRFSKDVGFLDALLPVTLMDCITVSHKELSIFLIC